LALQLWKEHRAIDMAHLILNKMNGDV
jgi:hypothetical protein